MANCTGNRIYTSCVLVVLGLAPKNFSRWTPLCKNSCPVTNPTPLQTTNAITPPPSPQQTTNEIVV